MKTKEEFLIGVQFPVKRSPRDFNMVLIAMQEYAEAYHEAQKERLPEVGKTMTVEEVGQKYGIINGFTLHSNPSIAKENFNNAMKEYASQFRQEVSDEEIEEKCSKLHYPLEAVGFGEGSRWMRNRMKGGEK
jgi:hypothetical protein